MDLSGNMTRQIEQDMPVQDDTSHIVNVGKLVEDMELKMRNLLRVYMFFYELFCRTKLWTEEVYFGKAKDVVGDLRSEHTLLVQFVCHANHVVGIPPLTEANREKATHQEMINSMKR